MKNFRIVATILAAIFSLTFAVLLFPEIVDDQGVFKALVYTGLGVAFIWLIYFLLGSLFGHLYEAGRKEERDSDTDFV